MKLILMWLGMRLMHIVEIFSANIHERFIHETLLELRQTIDGFLVTVGCAFRSLSEWNHCHVM